MKSIESLRIPYPIPEFCIVIIIHQENFVISFFIIQGDSKNNFNLYSSTRGERLMTKISH